METLKAGKVGDRAGTGKPGAFAGSMAEAIEDALNDLFVAEGRERFEVATNSPEARERRLLFCAIAQGVVNHLVAHADAFEVKCAAWSGEISVTINKG